MTKRSLVLVAALPWLVGVAFAQTSAPGLETPGVLAVFLAGLISFLSPCVLPLVPSYLAVLSGTGKQPLVGALGFVLGFSLMFVAFGASASALGSTLLSNKALLTKIGGVLILMFGLAMVFKNQIPFLNREYRADLGNASRFGPVVLGMAFAAGWTPCIGPILGTVLGVAASGGSVAQGVFLLAIYSLGLAVPFLLAALAWRQFAQGFRAIGRHVTTIERIGGVVMVVLGVLLVSDQFTQMAAFLSRFTPDWIQERL